MLLCINELIPAVQQALLIPPDSEWVVGNVPKLIVGNHVRGQLYVGTYGPAVDVAHHCLNFLAEDVVHKLSGIAKVPCSFDNGNRTGDLR